MKDFVPDWAKKAVWYQIFPERFRNGDPRNDPSLADIEGAFPFDQKSPWQIHPWTSDWYAMQPYERANGKDIWFQLQRRRYGGDLQGIIDKLDYLEDLGVTAIYLNPIFQSPSSHKYDGATYHHVDPNFGPDPSGDRALMEKETPDDPATWVFTAADKLAVQLIAEVHRRGMRIIFDGVWNHMGINSWAFRDVVKNQQRSKYKDWFTVTSWDDPEKGTKFDYKGWFGHKTLPELRQDENGTVSGPKAYIFAATRRWMDPNGDGNPSDGIDGWRLDVAFCIKHPFWKDWRRHVKAINPQAYTTAEVIEPVEKLRPYLQGDEFDAVMNYNFAFLSAQFFLGDKTRLSAAAFDRKLQELRVAFPAGVAYVQQNLFGSHDTNRIGSHIVNRGLGNYGDWGDYFGKSQATNPKYNTRKPNAEELRMQKLFVIFQMTYVGAPMIYYGDEIGMWGANDPCCRKPMVWDDLRYDDEATLPDGTTRSAPDKVEVNHELLAHYKKLIAIRNAHEALTLGNFHTLLADDDKNVFAFSRRHGNETILVVLNNSATAQKVMLEKLPAAAFQDLLNDGHDYSVKNGRLLLPLEAHWGAILLAK